MSEVSEESDVSVDRKICFRHSCRTKFIGSLNKKLSDDQKSRIEATPFAWLTHLNDSLKISRNLLSRLISRWVERLGGFDMGSEVVVFSLLDVCLGLSLRVVGQNIDLNEERLQSECKKLLGADKVVDTEMLYDYIVKNSENLSLDDFCKLYLVLAISEFLLPNRSGRIFAILFGIVDDISSVWEFNWGRVVHEYLVRSICEAKVFLRDRSSTKHFHLVGCVYLLQLWSFDHFLIIKANEHCPTLKFPRILNRMDVKVGDHVIKRSLKDNMVVLKVAASAEELSNSFVREGFEEYGRGTKGGSGINLMEAVERQQQVLVDLRKEIFHLKWLMNEKRKAGHKPGVEGNCVQNDEDYDVKTSGDKCGLSEDDIFAETAADVQTTHTTDMNELNDFRDFCEGDVVGESSGFDEAVKAELAQHEDVGKDEGAQSNMYARRRDDPRKRFKSCAIRTPFATYSRRKRHK